MISVATVVNILMLLYFHILNATTSQWTLEEVHHSEVERFLPPDHQWVKTTNQIVGRGQEVGGGGDQVSVLLESLIHSPFRFLYTKTPTAAAAAVRRRTTNPMMMGMVRPLLYTEGTSKKYNQSCNNRCWTETLSHPSRHH